MRADVSARLRPRGGPGDRLVQAVLDLAEGEAELDRHSEREWASATFGGSRHRLALAFRGAESVAAAERFIAQLPDHEFAIPGQIVADAAIISVDHRLASRPELDLVCELLLLAED